MNISGGECFSEISMTRSLASAIRSDSQRDRAAMSVVTLLGWRPLLTMRLRTRWTFERGESGARQAWERRMLKVDGSGEKLGWDLRMWWKRLTASSTVAIEA